MSFNFVNGKVAYPIDGEAIMSGNFIGDIDGDGRDLTNVSHITQTQAQSGRLVFFDATTSSFPGNERNIRGSEFLSFNQNTNVFKFGSGLDFGRRVVNTHASILVSDYYIGSNHTASITLTLPFASTLESGQTFTIKDESGQADIHNITIVRQDASSDLIDGETNLTIESPFGAISLYSNGNNKFFVF